MGQMHAGKMNCKKSGGEFFRQCKSRRIGALENGVD
jgi:uncharacterized short protein YbdD (DUF466 family)